MGAQHSKGHGLGNGLVNVTKTISKQRFAKEAMARRYAKKYPSDRQQQQRYFEVTMYRPMTAYPYATPP
jgi:hypothetical protein